MAGFGGFLQGLGLSYGNALIQGQNFQEQEARTSLLKSEALMQGIQAQKMQKQVQTEQQLGEYISSEMKLQGADAAQPQNQAKMFSKAAGLAAASGDFASMSEMNSLAKAATSEAREEATYAAQQQARNKDALGSAAQDYANNPTQEGFNDLAKKAIAAGVNPASIPVNPNSPEGKAWVNNQVLAGMDSKDRANFVQKVADMKARREKQWAIHQDNMALRLKSMASDAALREQMIGLRRDEISSRGPKTIEINGKIYEHDPDGRLKGARLPSDPSLVEIGEKLTAQQKTGVSRGSYAASEVSRSLQKVMEFDPGTAQSPFAGLGAHSFTDALTKVGANKLTPAQAQAMSVNAAGLGNQIASLESALGGRMAAGTQQQHLQDMTVPQEGDSGYTALYKIANGKELTITALEHLPGGYAETDAGKKQIAELKASIPFGTSDVIKMMKKDPQSQKNDTEIRKLVRDSAIVRSNIEGAAETGGVGSTGLPGGADAGAGHNVPPLPSDISTLVNKYGSQ